MAARNVLGTEPAGDYCVSDNFHIGWGPKPVPDAGVPVYGTVVLGLAAFLSVLGICALAFMLVRASETGGWGQSLAGGARPLLSLSRLHRFCGDHIVLELGVLTSSRSEEGRASASAKALSLLGVVGVGLGALGYGPDQRKFY